MELTDEQYNNLVQMHEQLGLILGNSDTDEETNAEYWQGRLRVLCDVLLKGGVVTYDEWGAIGQEHGYDRRGLGGYFTGNNPTIRQIFDGKKSITDEGVSQVNSFLNGTHRSGIKPTEEDLVKYASLTKTL